MEDSTFSHQNVIKLSKDMVFVRAEAKKDTVLRDKYNIAGYPTVILMNSSGEEIDRIFGYVGPDTFVTIIDDYLQGINTLDDLARKFEADSSNAILAFRLADKYEGRRMYDQAGVYYSKVVELDPEDQKGKSDDALFGLAWVEIRRKDYSKAMEVFKNFLQKFPKSEMALDAEMYIPYCYSKTGDTAQALELYQKFLTQHPDSPDTGWIKDKIKELKGSTDKTD